MQSTNSNPLPETGFLRLHQIIGRPEVSIDEAEANKDDAAELKKAGKRHRRPCRPCKAVPALIPVSAPTWWRGVKSGRFPAPVRIGKGITLWRVEDIRACLEKFGGKESDHG